MESEREVAAVDRQSGSFFGRFLSTLLGTCVAGIVLHEYRRQRPIHVTVDISSVNSTTVQ